MRRINWRIGIVIVTAAAVLSGCTDVHRFATDAVRRIYTPETGQTPPEATELAEPVVAVITPKPQPMVTAEYTAFIEKADYRLKLYEPAVGCYTGAYILSDASINFDIKRFEELVGKQHSMYSYYMSVGSNFPITWILSCISLSKTPNIILNPQSSELSDTDAALEKAAKEIGEFYTPMFVQFAPVKSQYDPEKYVELYRRAREIFRTHASNAAFVWTVSAEDVGDCNKYYPGDEYVDWVGLSVYENLVPGEASYDKDIFSSLDYFYYSYQRNKPIMLTELAISHLSSGDYIYRNELAADEISRIYSRIAESYPRIKAVTLMNVNGMNVATTKEITDDFSVTGEAGLVEAYRAAVDTGHYLSGLDVSSTGDMHKELMRSPFKVLNYNGKLMISAKTIEYDMGIRGVGSYIEKTVISGQDYYDLDSMSRFGIIAGDTDEQKNTLVIRK